MPQANMSVGNVCSSWRQVMPFATSNGPAWPPAACQEEWGVSSQTNYNIDFFLLFVNQCNHTVINEHNKHGADVESRRHERVRRRKWDKPGVSRSKVRKEPLHVYVCVEEECTLRPLAFGLPSLTERGTKYPLRQYVCGRLASVCVCVCVCFHVACKGLTHTAVANKSDGNILNPSIT